MLTSRAALNEILAVAPVALSNLAHTYNPSSGTLDTRDNLASLFEPADPAVICSALTATDQRSATRRADRQALRRRSPRGSAGCRSPASAARPPSGSSGCPLPIAADVGG